MKIILSRKGFDSSSGGCPNPILPDGQLLPLPIPDSRSPIRYCDINSNDINCSGINLGEIVSDITRGKITSEAGAHLDPDIDHSQYPRSKGWKPLLGQHGSAQGHLSKQGVSAGDLFMFFGLFQPIVKTDDGWRFDRTQSPCHHLWGWLQIGEVEAVSDLSDNELPWSRYHPHFHLPAEKNNSLYIATKQLDLGKSPLDISGAGAFPKSHAALQLTAPDARTPSQWRVPSWMYPAEGKTPLSYHYKLDRWQEPAPKQRYTQLQAVARGQEFVLDSQDYPQAKRWAQNLISRHGGQPVE